MLTFLACDYMDDEKRLARSEINLNFSRKLNLSFFHAVPLPGYPASYNQLLIQQVLLISK